MNKIDVLLSKEHQDMKMNFNTLQYFQVLEQNHMNNNPNNELLSLSNSKNDWFRLCCALLDKDFDNKVYVESNNIKVFHHTFSYHCRYRDNDLLMQKIQKIKTRKRTKSSSKTINNQQY